MIKARILAATLALCSSAALADRSVEELYPRSCGVCHAAAVGGAPKTGDTAAWQARLDSKGMEGLIKTVHTGLNAMPPKGMCMDCTDAEYEALIEYMMAPAS